MPVTISYLIVYYFMFKEKVAGVFLEEATKASIAQYISIAMISSLILLVVITICAFVKKTGLSKSILLHCSIVFFLWVFFIAFDPAVGWFVD